ncbi:lyase family protein [Sinorhizobium medicae]
MACFYSAVDSKLRDALAALAAALNSKAEEFAEIRKLGRTQLQDAVPMTLGQELAAFATTILEHCDRLTEPERLFLEVNIGGTAIETGSQPRHPTELVCLNVWRLILRCRSLARETSWRQVGTWARSCSTWGS